MLPMTFGAIRSADRSTWLTGLVFGLFLFAIFTLETYGVANTSAANAGFIISLFAVMVPLIDSIVYRRRAKLGLLGAVVLSVLGTALLTLRGAQIHVNLGDLLGSGSGTLSSEPNDVDEENDGRETGGFRGAHHYPAWRRCDWIRRCEYVSTPISYRLNAFVLAHHRVSCSFCNDVRIFHPDDYDSADVARSSGGSDE